jgi:gamma-glutamyltranspeptidase/glutathione hydrolase
VKALDLGRATLPVAALAVVCGLFSLYRATLLPGLDFGDSAFFQFRVGSPVLTPRDGYPLYFAAGKLVRALTPGEPARALNLASAIEAAIAVGAVIAVTYPHFCGIGGDAIWMIADGEGRRTTLMGVGQAAASMPRFKSPIPVRGAPSTLTSAGAVDTWRLAHEYSRRHWNGRTSLAALLEPAIVCADDGFPCTRSQVFWTEFRRDELSAWPGFGRIFLPGGRVPQAGEPFVQRELARSLRRIAEHGPRDFYEGELAAALARGLAQAGSALTADDLRRTHATQEEPATLDYRGLTLLAPPPPTQGVTTLAIMGILQHFDLASVPEGSAEYFHLCVEAVKQAFLDRGEIALPQKRGRSTGVAPCPGRTDSGRAIRSSSG